MPDVLDARLAKLDKLRSKGILAYADHYQRTHTLEKARDLPMGTQGIRLAGRLMLLRPMGKLTFATIQDSTAKIQILAHKGRMSEEEIDLFRSCVDIGDFIGVEGELMKTQTGEITLDLDHFTFLSKTLRPLPEKFHGLADREICYRKRYLDLIANPETRERFILRSRIIDAFRRFFVSEGYVEVETPMLQSKPSGALARPFFTRHNALDIELAMRIAPETYLKRLIVGGLDKVFELGKCFRNEGMDAAHLQEFTMVEFYQAYANMEELMALVQRMLPQVLTETLGCSQISWKGETYDFGQAWPAFSMRDLILKETRVDLSAGRDCAHLKALVVEAGVEVDLKDCHSKASVIDELYKKAVRPKLKGPLFITGHPIELSPLARQNDQDPGMADRFQVVVAGEEIVNAYSELADPQEQMRRFQDQAQAREAGDEEAHVMDQDFVEALEHGMPPTAGCGIGIDRFVALVTGQENLRDVIFFPLMKGPGETGVEPHSEAPPQEAPKAAPLPFSREQALEWWEAGCKDAWLRTHTLASEAILRQLARDLGQPEDLWGLAGLLHDLDFEQTQENMAEHGQLTAKKLRESGAPEEMVRAILSHNSEHTGVQPESVLDVALSAAEQITGLIVAASLVLPDKKVSSLKPKSVLKRMQEKAFAKKVDRDRIRACEKFGMDLERFVTLSVEAMKPL